MIIENIKKELLDIMQRDVSKFNSIINPKPSIIKTRYGYDKIIFEFEDWKYYKIPTFKYIEPNDFIARFLQMEFEDKNLILSSLKERYSSGLDKKFVGELDWLQSVRQLLLQEATSKKGKLSGYLLKSEIIPILDEVLKELESKTQSIE